MVALKFVTGAAVCAFELKLRKLVAGTKDRTRTIRRIFDNRFNFFPSLFSCINSVFGS